ncbi:MAG: galactose oxidase [Armatimonadota bacterium]
METLLQFRRIADIPNSRGLAAPFAGVLNTQLVVAGGANFPNAYPWEGGTKVWHDRVYRLREPDARWEMIGHLPQPLGYGASFTVDGGVVVAGGSDSGRHYASCWLMMEQRGHLVVEPLPKLPLTLANVGFAKLGNLLIIVGGQETPTSISASKRVFALDCTTFGAGWFELPPLPGPGRILPGVGVVADSLFVCSGADLYPGPDGKAVRKYLRDCYRYTGFGGWKRITDLPKPAVAPPCPLPQIADGLAVFSGDDGSRAWIPQSVHPGFDADINLVTSMRIRALGSAPFAHVTATAVRWRDSWVIPSGEIRPGVRTPAVWMITSSGE